MPCVSRRHDHCACQEVTQLAETRACQRYHHKVLQRPPKRPRSLITEPDRTLPSTRKTPVAAPAHRATTLSAKAQAAQPKRNSFRKPFRRTPPRYQPTRRQPRATARATRPLPIPKRSRTTNRTHPRAAGGTLTRASDSESRVRGPPGAHSAASTHGPRASAPQPGEHPDHSSSTGALADGLGATRPGTCSSACSRTRSSPPSPCA